MEKVVINVIYRKVTVSAINRTDCWIHRIGTNTGISRADEKTAEACFTSVVYIGREITVYSVTRLGGKHYPAICFMLFTSLPYLKVGQTMYHWNDYCFKDEAQTALFKDAVRTAQ